MEKPPKIRILGCDIDNLTMAESLQKIEEIISARKPVQHVVVNAGKMVAMHKNKRLNEIVNACVMINADGQAVVWAAKFLGRPLPERVAGIDLMYRLIERAAEKGYSVYFLGAREEVVREVVSRFGRKYPSLKIAGYRNGYFSEADNEEIVKNINEAKPDLLFVGMSTPKKEYWLAENLDKIGVPFSMGVGGSFDVAAGITKRAPLWIQNAGLEWFYRLLQEPRRMWKRYLVGNLNFIWMVVKEKLGLSGRFK